jgi:hypothetical protein
VSEFKALLFPQMLEKSGSLEVKQHWKDALRSSVIMELGVQCAMITGMQGMLKWCVDNLAIQLMVCKIIILSVNSHHAAAKISKHC